MQLSPIMPTPLLPLGYCGQTATCYAHAYCPYAHAYYPYPNTSPPHKSTVPVRCRREQIHQYVKITK